MARSSTLTLAPRIGTALRMLRHERTALSQEDFARRVRVHRTYIGTLERGLTNPSIELLERVGRGLGVPVSEIVRRAEELPVTTPRRPRRRAKKRAPVSLGSA